MWNCNKCGNQNEENFKFCWSCGKPKSVNNIVKIEVDRNIPLSKPTDFEPDRTVSNFAPLKDEIPKINKTPEIKAKEPRMVSIPPIKTEKNTDKIKEKLKETEIAEEIEKPEVIHSEPELFTTFIPKSERENVDYQNDTNWENVGFTIAVRIAGLYFILLVLTSIPEFVSTAYFFLTTQNAAISGFEDLISNALFVLTAKLFFYLILGIYLIAGGRILLRLLPSN